MSTSFYTQLLNIFCNWLNAAPNSRYILPKNLSFYSLTNAHAKLSNDSINRNCSLWLIRLFKCLFYPSIRLSEYIEGLIDSGNSKKLNKSVISDNVFVILGYLDNHVSKKLYKAACIVLAV